MFELSEDVQELLQQGYNRRGTQSPIPTPEFERQRYLCRSWRNLVGEARFDIPRCLYEYINWEMPMEWEQWYRPPVPWVHDFTINIPRFKPISVVYKRVNSDWIFDRFEIICTLHTITSTKYMDLPLFLAMAKESNRPTKRKVEIEEVNGGLAENANLIKIQEKNRTMIDWINPDCDMDFDPTTYPGCGTA